LKLDFDTVIPGHGPISKRADLAAWKKNFEAVKDRLSELRKQGKARDEVAKLLRLDDLGWKPSANWEKGLGALYDELGR
jgi:glyoxylase-like metal-dependent hydrolase (beta-lactamase superfamily II)